MSGESDELATLIADVRHDTNNSLMVMFGALENLFKRKDIPDPAVARLKLIETEAYKIRDYIARTSFIRKPGE